ncbi:MAG: UDP-N-acetylmuramoyl-tripeptide--D-alanyl-D-alanine ligase [Francisella sp.]
MIKSLKKLALQSGLEYFGDDVAIQTVSINSKVIKKDCLFVAIIANRDGHEFIPDAISNGAKALLVSTRQNVSIPQIICSNTIKGLRALAKQYRQTLKMPIISLTGSCGKTTVKEMIVTLLGDKKVHFTQGNLNNYLGVPITVLETPQDIDFAVIEAGTSVVGEIKAAAEIIKPNIAMITNIGASHLEQLKTLDGVLVEKGELLKSLQKEDYCIVNLDDERIASFVKKLECKKITCSMHDSSADIFILDYQVKEDFYTVNVRIFDNNYSYKLPKIGKHNLLNSLLAIACVIATGGEPKDFLANTQNIKSYQGRFSVENINDKLTLVDDTYNASVNAVKSAIEDLEEFDGKKVLVISSMRELGAEAENYHRKMGQWLNKAELDNILLFGEKDLIKFVLEEYRNSNIKYYEEKNALNNDLLKILNKYRFEKTKIIVKGARSFKMEDVVKFIKDNF